MTEPCRAVYQGRRAFPQFQIAEGSIAQLSVHQAVQGTARGVVGQVLTEHLHVQVTGIAQGQVAGDMGREDQILGIPQEMVLRQGLGNEHVQRRARQQTGVQSVCQGPI